MTLASAALIIAMGNTFDPLQPPRLAAPVDDPSREWCFLAKTTTVIGVPFQPDVTQVTFDGSLFTRGAELCFFTGPESKPMLARQRAFLEGWIPIVGYTWREGPIRYDWEAFAATLDGEDARNSVNFVRFRLTNTSKVPERAVLTVAMRHTGKDYRFGGSPFSNDWSYEMTPDAAFCDGKLVYSFAPGARLQAVAGEPYRETFKGSDKAVDESTPACLARYDEDLVPGQTIDLTFKMPRASVADSGFLAKLRAADYAAYRSKTVAFWKRAVLGGAEFRIPEARVQNAQRASLVHMMLATRERDGHKFQSDGLPYPNLFLSSNMQAQQAYDFLGRLKDYEINLPEILARQNADGIFMDTSLPQNGEPLIAAHGQTLEALCYHYILTRNQAYARKILPAIVKAVEWLRRARERDPYGLMPASWPYDAEMIKGHYTSHNLWCLLGLRSAIRMARDIGEQKLAVDWTKLQEAYQASLLAAITASAGNSGYVPTGLYDFVTGNAARQGFREYQTNQDWENMLLVAPTEVLDPYDPRVEATVSRLRRTKFREGVMTYRNGQHLHQYITANVLEQDMARGRQEQALIDLYHMLLHNGPTHEGFENLVEPWTREVWADCPPPHAWAAMKLALVIRNALIVERGGRAGLDEDQRDLHLFSLMSPAWAVPGKEMGFRDAPCEMGRLSASLRFTSAGASLALKPAFRVPPHRIVVHVPYFVDLKSFQTDASSSSLAGATIVLSPDATRLAMAWTLRPDAFKGVLQRLLLSYRREPSFHLVDGEGVVTPGGPGFLTDEEKNLPDTPLSFATVLKAYLIEYHRRLDEFVRQGGALVPVEAPALRP